MTLFASVLRINRADCRALKITDTYSLHRVVYSLFSDVCSEAEKFASVSSGIQWVDRGGDALHRQILMLSNRAPFAKAKVPAVANEQDGLYGEVISKCLPPHFLEHQQYRFEVVMNPVRRDNRSRNDKPIKGREAIRDWFIDRAPEHWGFPLLNSFRSGTLMSCNLKLKPLIKLRCNKQN